jgi:hypothetical protein
LPEYIVGRPLLIAGRLHRVDTRLPIYAPTPLLLAVVGGG